MTTGKQEPKPRMKWTLEKFIEESRRIHGDDGVDYSEAVFTTSNNKIRLICRNHDEPVVFEPRLIDRIIKKSRCPVCSKAQIGGKVSSSKGAGQEAFLAKATAIHGDRYDLSKAFYHRVSTPVIIGCQTHGDFEITPQSFIIAGAGCWECGRVKALAATTKSKETFVEEARAKHGDLYDYPDPYVNTNTPIKIVCKEHGPFLLRPSQHIYGQGCMTCGAEAGKSGYPYTLELFIAKANEVHSNKFDYSRVQLGRSTDRIEIICPAHDSFEQVAAHHLQGDGCRQCSRSISKAEKALAKRVEDLGLTIIQNQKHGLGFELDVYIPALKIGIEYNGLVWHSESFKDEEAPTYHLRKTERCEKAGIRLIHVWEDDWEFRNETCWNWLKTQLGFPTQTLNGRDCEVRACSWHEVDDFIQRHHIQGQAAPTRYLYGLFHKTEGLVAVMTLGTQPGQAEGSVVLKRFCSSGIVRGGFSKMLKAFLREHAEKYLKVVSFSDRSWSQGSIYSKNGFVEVGTTPPRYYWTKASVRYNRWEFQHQYLAKRLKVYDPSLTEVENCHANGYSRLWDSGLKKWELKL